MNIKLGPKNTITALTSLACAFALCKSGKQDVQDFEIKELNDNEFEQFKKLIEKKKSKLNKNNLSILSNIPVNKYNIQCLNILMDSNKDFRYLYDTLTIDNINSAKLLAYELKNKKEIEEKLGSGFIIHDAHMSVETQEDADFKIKLIEYGLKNRKAGSNIYFSEIVKNAKNMNEALYMLDHSEKYGMLPKSREYLNERYGETLTDKMLEGVAEAKKKYGLNLDYMSAYANSYREQYNVFRTAGNTIFRFDTKTGEIVALEKDNSIYNFKNNTVSRVIPESIKKDEKAFMDSEKLLGAQIETRDLTGALINRSRFKKSKIKGEFETEDITGRAYKTGLAEIGRKGGRHIEKHFTSFDGTVTDYVYADDKKGNRYLYYKITDKDNKVLYQSEKQFKVLSPNHFQSMADGIKYDIQFDAEKVKAVKLDGSGKTAEYKIKKYTDYKGIEEFIAKCLSDDKLSKKLENGEITLGGLALENKLIDKYTIDRKLAGTLRHLSGDEWFALKNADVYALISSHNKDSAYSQGNLVEVGSKNNLLSVIEHEIGHEKAKAIKLDEDEKLKQIYEYEKNLFTTNLPDIAVKQAGYFLRNIIANGLSETCAEANLIINAPQCWNGIGSRTMFLQRYFPRTITYLANKYKDLS